jgi:AraC-like DNA-binding protein
MELAELIENAIRADGVEEPVAGLRLTRASEPTDRIHAVSRPSLCIIAQGAKEVYLGDRLYRYDPESYLLATIEVPLTGRVVEASRARPYLALRLDFDALLIGSVMVEAGLTSPSNHGDAKAIVVSPLDSGLLDAIVRLARLLHSPSEAGVLMPLVKREIVFRLLTGAQGARLRHIPLQGGYSDRIAEAVARLRKEFDRPLRIERLAKDMGMSPSGFHHHFKTVTDMSPLQFQKQIRLQEARRLMLGENLDASSAGYRVGYEDPSHFSRDYKRLFGDSPARDAERLRTMIAAD